MPRQDAHSSGQIELKIQLDVGPYWFKLRCMKSLLILLVVFIAASCTKELKYSKEEIYAIAKAADSSVTFILPKSISEGVNCADYAEGCQSAHIVQVRGIDFIAVEFMTEAQAKFGAKKIRGYYIRNWVFDDVTGEPTLEKFVSESLKAQKP